MPPAARMGDTTAHGGTIVSGLPTVLIGGQPAARVGDMHVCPLVNADPAASPHVGGALVGPGAATVLIGGQPAAVIGDSATCVSPAPNSVVAGYPTVLLGG
jgi:uncharacterized Zn-binding protein involved in type VI secretion